MIVHRAVLGSVERMYAILTEHYASKWPLWLSPRGAMVVPISEKVYGYADKVGFGGVCQRGTSKQGIGLRCEVGWAGGR